MTAKEKKQILRERYLKPKKKLREMRLAKELTTEYMASVAGLERRQYEQKEHGRFPFHDYEMESIAKELNSTVEEIFYAD